MNNNDRCVSIRELTLLGAQVKERLGSPISTTLALGTGMPRQVAVEKAGDGTGGTGSGHPAAPAQEAVPVPAAVPAQAPVANDRAAELKTAPADATKALAMIDRKSKRLNSSHSCASRMPSSA